MTTSFFIRTSKNNPTASICIRITEGRGQQYRFNTGHRLLKASSWNKNTQSVRTVASESYDLINLQLRRLKAHIESKAVSAKSDGVHRTEGGQTMTKRVPKYQLIKTHTARRSFCTNAYKAGMDCLDIMALSGHTTDCLLYTSPSPRD